MILKKSGLAAVAFHLLTEINIFLTHWHTTFYNTWRTYKY